MFEHIYFIKQVYSTPVSSNNYRSVFPFDLEEGNAEGFHDHLEQSYYRYLADCEFYLNGTVQMVPYYPVTQEVLEKLLYIESFSVFSSLRYYYTERKNLDSYLLLYTYEGRGRLTYNGKTRFIEKGEGFLIDCKTLHRYEAAGETWKHADLHFNGMTASMLFNEFSKGGTVVFSPASGEAFQESLEDIIRTYESVGPCRELLVSNKIENLIVSLITNTGYFKKAGSEMPEGLEYSVFYMNNNYMHPLTLDDLADSVGISKYQFIRAFRKYVGFTPQEYLIQLRLKKATELLASTDIPANKIGYIVGIENTAYFYRLFKNRIGKTPKEYRAEQRNP